MAGSLQEKEVLDKAYRKIKQLETSSSQAEFSLMPPAHEDPVNLSIQLQSKSCLLLGQDIPLSIAVSNHSGAEKVAHLVLRAQSLHYTGVPIAQLWKEEFHFTLRSNEGRQGTGCTARAVHRAPGLRTNTFRQRLPGCLWPSSCLQGAEIKHSSNSILQMLTANPAGITEALKCFSCNAGH